MGIIPWLNHITLGVIAMPLKNLDITKIGDRWASNGAASGEKYRERIMAITESPLQKAADSGAAYLAGIQRAEAEGKRSRGLLNYGFENWKQRTATVGSARLGQGMAASKENYKRAMAPVLAYEQQVYDSLPPRGTLEQNIERSATWQRRMSQFRKGGM